MLGTALDLTSARAAAWWQAPAYLAADKAGSGIWPPGFAASFRNGQYAATTVAPGSIGSADIADLTRLSPTSFADMFDYSRASSAGCIGADGTLSTAAADTPRFDYSNGRRQLLLEGPSTNTIRNNTMLGAAAGIIGSGGALPTNWTSGGTGLTRTVIGTGTSKGVDYVDIRFHGTIADGNGAMLSCEGTQEIAALTAERWSMSTWLALVGGSLSSATGLRLTFREGTTAGGFVLQTIGADIKSLIGSGLKRFGFSAPLAGGATTAFVQPRVSVAATTSTVLDFTLRIGLPQCERQGQSTSAIRTSGTAVTRAADDCRLSAAGAALLGRAASGLAIRGSGVWGSSGALLGAAAGTRLLALNSGQTALGIGHASPLVIAGSLTAPLPDFGITAGWDATGRAGAYGGGTAQQDASVIDADLSSARLGRNDGTAAFAAGWYDELAIYPFQPSGAALATLSTAPA
jgi:hypothetical protein